MIACIDVGYCEGTARAACVTFGDWEDATSINSTPLMMDFVRLAHRTM